jgi:hypothetical protein
LDFKMSELIHTPECIKETEAIEAAIDAWENKWPNYCRNCGAAGGFYNPGVYRYPDGSGEPPSFDECPNCVDESRCPRCGMDWKVPLDILEELASDTDTIWLDTFLFEESYPCPCCGWAWGEKEDDIRPPDLGQMGPCACELEEDERLSKAYREQQ